MSYCVYSHKCPNGKHYIGITSKSPKERWKNGYGYRNNNHFFNAIKKYGWENIEHTILADGLDFETACELEIKYIKDYDSIRNGYNHSSGGDKSGLGFHHTEETKRKIADAGRGRKQSAKSRQATIESRTIAVKVYDIDGNYLNTFKSLTEAEKATHINNSNISYVCKGKYNQCGGYIFRYADDTSEVTKVRCRTKPVDMYSLSGQFIKHFKSIKEASRTMGICDTHITDACKGKYKHCGGYIWKYT